MEPRVRPFTKRPIPPSDSFFDAGNLARELCWKKLSIATSDLEFMQAEDPIVCGVDGCRAELKSVEMYEVHYASLHVNVCSVCNRVFPTCRLLSLHVQEAHDSFFAEMAKRENMYECLVEGCTKKFKGDFQRRWHLINVHQYPKTFRFHFEPAGKESKKEKKGKKNKHSPSAPLHKPARRDETMKQDDMIEDPDAGQDEAMQDLCDGVRKLALPAQIKFGHNSERGLLRPRRDKTEAVKKKQRKPFGPKASNREGETMLDVGERRKQSAPTKSSGMDTDEASAAANLGKSSPTDAME